MHSRNLYRLLLLLALPLFSFGQNNRSALFSEGNQLYAKAQYEQAVKVYQRLLDSGSKSAAIYFNLGNAYYKMDNMPSAILNYEKAYKLAPSDADIQHNLQLANLKITDKIEAVPTFFLVKWWRAFMLIFSLQIWAILGVSFFIAGFLLLIIYLFAKIYKLKKTTFYIGIILLVFGLISLIMANVQYNYFDTHQEAIVFNGTVNVKSAPGDKQKTLFIIHEGTKVKLGQQEDSWVKIELPNGNIGWIEHRAIRPI